jgi:flagellar motor protein MotB
MLEKTLSQTTNDTNVSSEERRIAFSLLQQIAISRAAEIAHIGRYAQAETMLSEVGGESGSSTASLDLCARINAQQGKLVEAGKLWAQALEMEPDNKAYRGALDRITKLQKRPHWFIFAPRLLTLVAFILCLIVGGFAIRKYINSLRDSVKSEANRLGETFTQTTLQESTATKAHLKINLPGVVAKNLSGETTITFNEGIFLRNAQIKPDAKVLLTNLGQQLEQDMGNVSIRIIGHTDNEPMPSGKQYKDNTDLGLARATTVFQHLRETTRLPVATLSVSSVGETNPPYPSDAANRTRNRTVVLLISENRK